MWVGYKKLGIGWLAVGLALAVWARTDGDVHDAAWYAAAVQDVVSFNAEEDDAHMIRLNDEPTTLEQLADRLKRSDSVCLLGYDSGEVDGTAQKLIDVLMLIGNAGIDDKFIDLNLEYISHDKSSDDDIVKIDSDGSLFFNGDPVELSQLSDRLSDDREVGIVSDTYQAPPPLSRILAVANVVGKQRIDFLLISDRNRQVKIMASIVEIGTDGTEKLLSAPRITTQPGCAGMIRAVQNNSGYDSFFDKEDPFHQEDLGNLGVRFSVTPFLMGDHIRVAGVIVLTKSAAPRQQMFKQGDMPIYSYSVSKFVCPFSCVIADGESVELPVGSVEGRKTVCLLRADLVDGKGMTKEERDAARSSGD